MAASTTVRSFFKATPLFCPACKKRLWSGCGSAEICGGSVAGDHRHHRGGALRALAVPRLQRRSQLLHPPLKNETLTRALGVRECAPACDRSVAQRWRCGGSGRWGKELIPLQQRATKLRSCCPQPFARGMVLEVAAKYANVPSLEQA